MERVGLVPLDGDGIEWVGVDVVDGGCGNNRSSLFPASEVNLWRIAAKSRADGFKTLLRMYQMIP